MLCFNQDINFTEDTDFNMLLIEEIELAQIEVHKRVQWLEGARYDLKLLLEKRVNCKHEFSPPYKNYEHEGGRCKLCGINELEAISIKQRT